MKWSIEPWRKLYTRVSGDWTSRLSVMARCMSSELIKYANDEGRVCSTRGRMPGLAVALVLSPLPEELEATQNAANELLDDGYLVTRDDGVYIKNFIDAQERSLSAIRQQRYRDRKHAEQADFERNTLRNAVTPSLRRSDPNRNETNTDKATDAVADIDFDTFWSEYPRKTNKASAKKAFGKRVRSEQALQRIMAALQVYKRFLVRQKTAPEFVLHASTFLNGKWEDYVDEKPESKSLTSRAMTAAEKAAAREAAQLEENRKREEQERAAALQASRLGREPETQRSNPGNEPGRSGGVESRGVGNLFDRERLQGTTPHRKPDPHQCMGSGYGRGNEGGYVAAPYQGAPAPLQGGRNETGVSSLLECEKRNSEPLERNSAGSTGAVFRC